jgi:hypothetical protein
VKGYIESPDGEPIAPNLAGNYEGSITNSLGNYEVKRTEFVSYGPTTTTIDGQVCTTEGIISLYWDGRPSGVVKHQTLNDLNPRTTGIVLNQDYNKCLIIDEYRQGYMGLLPSKYSMIESYDTGDFPIGPQYISDDSDWLLLFNNFRFVEDYSMMISYNVTN